MKTADILKLTPPAATDSVLYLWAIVQRLPDALAVMAAWGYDYKTNIVWDKLLTGTGYWARGQHEHLLIGVRGDAKPPPPELRIGSVIRCRRGKHSQKPDEVRTLLSKWYPNKSKLEMFARGWTELWPKQAGWHYWGNELPNDVVVPNH